MYKKNNGTNLNFNDSSRKVPEAGLEPAQPSLAKGF